MDISRPVSPFRIGTILFLLAVLLLLANAQRDLERRLQLLDTEGRVQGIVATATTEPMPTIRVVSLGTAIPVVDVSDQQTNRTVARAQIIPLATAPPAATMVPLPETVIEIPLEEIILIDEPTRNHVLDIFARGQERGRNPQAFSKIGDSSIADGYFLTRFDGDEYQLGPYDFLQVTLDYYAGSFARDSAAVRLGMHSWSILDPFWSDRSLCEVGESPLSCEDRLHNPAMVIIRLGTNDFDAPQYFESNMREIVETLLVLDIVPILGTKADRIDGPLGPNNAIIRKLAAEYQLPLWDFELVAKSLPGRGLAPDGIHLTTYYAHDYGETTAYERGHSMQNLTAILLLEEMRRLMMHLPSAAPAGE